MVNVIVPASLLALTSLAEILELVGGGGGGGTMTVSPSSETFTVAAPDVVDTS